MSLADWYLVIFALGAGVGIGLYWMIALVFHRLPVPENIDRKVLTDHVVAEFVTIGFLLAAGIAALIEFGPLAEVLMGLGIGTTIYALVQSPRTYPVGSPARVALYGSWPFVIAALVVLLVRVA